MPAPADRVGEQAADQRRQHRRDAADGEHQRERLGGRAAGDQVGDDRPADDHAAGAGEALHQPGRRRAPAGSARARRRTPATTQTAALTTSGRRRPSRSDSGPITSWPKASPTRNDVSVSWTALADGAEVGADLREARQVEVGRDRRDGRERGEHEQERPADRRRSSASGAARWSVTERSQPARAASPERARSRMPVIGPGDAQRPLSRRRVRCGLTGCHDLGRRHAVRRRAGAGRLRLRAARRRLDGQQLRRRRRRRAVPPCWSTPPRPRSATAPCSPRSPRSAPARPRAVVNTHHHPDHTYGNGFLPAETVGHRPRQVPRDGARAPASRRPR